MARKITMDSVHAFIAGKPFHRENMSVTISNNGTVYLRLHGNAIATKTKDDMVYIDACGWYTVTTKERLNYLLDTYNLPRIYQKNWLWYIGSNPWNGGKTCVYNPNTIAN